MSRNLPNQITIGRLVLAAVFFVLLARYDATDSAGAWILDVAFWIFIVACLTDLVDGYVARKYNLETMLGRILDPFVDKVLVCGAFVFFLGHGFIVDGENVTGVSAWMVVLILSRELLVTGLRSEAEASGVAFGAGIAGKLKMWLQSVTVGFILITLAHSRTLCAAPIWGTLRTVVVYVAVGVTIVSMLVYLPRARGVLGAESRA